ncbi:MAG: excinuclease ABC subunit UvrC [Polyangiales bacterium]
MDPEALRLALDTLPTSPGVYVFKADDGSVLYVGKARSLRSRVRSYFQPNTGDVRFFIARLERELGSLETFVTANEKEAALLENQLIKAERPRYNVKLRDDKEYLSLRLDPKASWPRLEVVRKPRRDGAHYFGPYHSATAARQTLRLVNRHFQLRTCTDAEMKSRVRPCLQYQIKRCPGPCVLEVDREAYGTSVKDVAMFLGGRHDELREQLEQRMRSAAAAMDYERAAVHRDQLRAIDVVGESQRVSAVRDLDQDVIGVHRQADQAEVAVLVVRAGKLVRVRTFALKDVSLPDDELVASFVLELYGQGGEIPDEVLVPFEIEAMDGVAELLAEARGKKVVVRSPKRGANARLVEMARENAEHAFKEKRRAEQDVEERLRVVMEKLRLPRLPRRIECVDISHTGGEDTVAMVVALEDAAPDRKRYKSFHVKTVSGGDDYGAIREVLSRRLRRGRDAEKGWDLPDLLVVDGGRGQLRMAVEALAELGVTELPVASLAKEKENVRGDKLVDRVYLPGQKNPIPLVGTPALAMLALARDEAHRASNELRTKVGKKKRLGSALDAIPGVGPKTRGLLLRALGSVKAIAEASEETLVAAGATEKQARALRAALAPETGTPESGTVEDAERMATDNAFVDGSADDA